MVSSAFGLRLGIGLGVSRWGGVGQDNPFSADGRPFGDLMPAVRVAMSLEYRAWRRVYLATGPSFAISRTTVGALSQTVTSLAHFDAIVGLVARL
jgi:hypothetical protein